MPSSDACPQKRKASPIDDDKAASSKKSKLAGHGKQLTNADQSNANLKFAPRTPGTVKMATWNICGLAACQKKGFRYYVETEDPDILVLTETKVNYEPVDPVLKTRFPYGYWCIADKKGYAGTAILTKNKAMLVSKVLPGHPDPSVVKGRIITLEFERYYLVGTYVPNAGEKLKTLDVKKKWNKHFTTYIRDLDKKKPVIWTGDLNVAPTENDLANAKKNWNKSAGYTEAETAAFKQILDPSPEESDETAGKFVDVWRKLHPSDQKYTYFSYRFNCRAKGIGWRIDMFVLSERIVDHVKMCEIRDDVYGSDHVPLVMEIGGELSSGC